jgi:uncharacterized protein (TIGR03437 family)
LTPAQSSHLVLLKQADGSYTGIEISSSPPYQILSTTPNYQKQVMACPAPVNFTPPVQVPQAIAQAKSGGYVSVSLLNQTPRFGAPVLLDVVAFDSGFHFIGENLYPLNNQSTTGYGLQVSVPAGTPVLADLNGDGILDIVVPAAMSGDGDNFVSGFEAFLGTGGASYQAPVFYQASLTGDSAWYSGAVAVADVNGDGKLDVALTSYSGQGMGRISVFPGNGDGTFRASQLAISLPAGDFPPGPIAVADFNGDGIEDIAYCYNSGPVGFVAVALGEGNGNYAAPQSYPGAGPLTVGDVDGDGNLDIVVEGTSILYGDGKGNFPRRRDMIGVATGSAILTDFNGDGLTDIVIGTGNASVLAGGFVAVYPGESNGAFVAAPETLVAGLAPVDSAAIAAGDLNGDGIPDIALAFGPKAQPAQNTLAILKGNGDGSLTTGYMAMLANMPVQVSIADLNGDGKPDVAVLEQGPNGAVEVFLGQGNGTFGGPIATAIPAGGASLAVGDFNGDGKLDLAVITANSLEILPGNGDGTFGAPIVTVLNFSPASITAGDFNGNGKPDVAIANPGTAGNMDGTLVVLLGNGDGTFAAMPGIPMSYGVNIGPFFVTSDDLNRDGNLDLVALTAAPGAYSGGAAVLLGNGDGTFQTPVIYPVPIAFGTASVAAADLNGDKIPDLILPGGYLLGLGDGTFQPFAAAPIGPQAIADFNGDGKVDFASLPGFGVAVTLNLSPAGSDPPLLVYSAASLAAGPLAPESIGAAFGANLASTVAVGDTSSPPDTLAGITVSVVDSAGTSRTAPLLYVSPHQINFQIPAGTAAGMATISVSGPGIPSASAQVQIAFAAPALFTANAGAVATGYLLSVDVSGETKQPFSTVQNGLVVPAPVNVNSGAVQLYLVLFGTGIRNVATSCFVDSGIPYAQIDFVGPKLLDAVGVDQVNLLMPSSSVSPLPIGNIPIAFNCGGIVTNTVYVAIQ